MQEREELSAYVKFKMSTFTDVRGMKLPKESDWLETEPERDTMLHYRWQCAHFMNSSSSRSFFIGLVTINAILMGVQADHGNDNDLMWIYTESAFVCIFVIEILLKFWGFGYLFFFDNWNNIDLVVVAFSVFETVTVYAALANGDDMDTSGASAVRLIRVLRIIRLVGFLERLNLLVTAFVMALQDIVWVVLLILIILYIFGIIAQNFFGNSTELVAV